MEIVEYTSSNDLPIGKRKDLKRKRLVRSNRMIESRPSLKNKKFRYRVNTTQLKILAKLATMVNSFEDKEFFSHSFQARELLEELKLGSENFTHLRESIIELMRTIITIRDEEKKCFIDLPMISKAMYYDNGTIELSFAEEMKPFFLSLQGEFTKYYLNNIINLKSNYSFKLFELLKQYETIGERIITIDDLKFYLDVYQGQYKAYKDFRIRVIEQAQKELDEYCDIHFTFEPIKTGRKVTSIKFYIFKNFKNLPKKQLEQANKREIYDISHKEAQFKKMLDLGILEHKALKICKEHPINEIENGLEILKEAKISGKINTKLTSYFIGVMNNIKNGVTYEEQPKSKEKDQNNRRQSSADREAKRKFKESSGSKGENNKEPLSLEELQKLFFDKFQLLQEQNKEIILNKFYNFLKVKSEAKTHFKTILNNFENNKLSSLDVVIFFKVFLMEEICELVEDNKVKFNLL